MTDGEKIAKAAAEWLGTPHINGAKVKGRGVDCGMLLIGCVEDAELLKKTVSGLNHTLMNGTCITAKNGF